MGTHTINKTFNFNVIKIIIDGKTFINIKTLAKKSDRSQYNQLTEGCDFLAPLLLIIVTKLNAIKSIIVILSILRPLKIENSAFLAVNVF